ncbi:hypothetical protein Tco_1319877 [Tanacetum coccineum]
MQVRSVMGLVNRVDFLDASKGCRSGIKERRGHPIPKTGRASYLPKPYRKKTWRHTEGGPQRSLLLTDHNGRQVSRTIVSKTLNEARGTTAPGWRKLALFIGNNDKKAKEIFCSHREGSNLSRISSLTPQDEKGKMNKSLKVRRFLSGDRTTQRAWTLYTDGVAIQKGSGAGLILTDLCGVEICLSKEILVEVLNERSTEVQEVQTIVEEEGDNWMTPIIKYLEEGIVPSDNNEARALRPLQANVRHFENSHGIFSGMHGGPENR